MPEEKTILDEHETPDVLEYHQFPAVLIFRNHLSFVYDDAFLDLLLKIWDILIRPASNECVDLTASLKYWMLNLIPDELFGAAEMASTS